MTTVDIIVRQLLDEWHITDEEKIELIHELVERWNIPVLVVIE